MGRQAFKQQLALKYAECLCRDDRVPWSIQQVDLTLSQGVREGFHDYGDVVLHELKPEG